MTGENQAALGAANELLQRHHEVNAMSAAILQRHGSVAAMEPADGVDKRVLLCTLQQWFRQLSGSAASSKATTVLGFKELMTVQEAQDVPMSAHHLVVDLASNSDPPWLTTLDQIFPCSRIIFNTRRNTASGAANVVSFTSCVFDQSGTCAGVTAVATNAASISAGVGMLTLKGLIKPRCMQILSQVSTKAILALCKRPEPGTPFMFDASVTGMKVLGAINMGQITYDYAAASIMHLIDGVDVTAASATAQIAKYRGVLESFKSKATGTTGALVETGVMPYLWAKISEFVMKRKMTTKLLFDSVQGGAASSSSATQLGATLHRPKSMEDFAEMMNLFVMMAFSLGLASAVVTTDFFQHVVYNTLRVHTRCWMIAHELLMIMFRLIEDSGGRLTFGNCYDENYLNTVLEEAETNKAVFFRSLGANPSFAAGKNSLLEPSKPPTMENSHPMPRSVVFFQTPVKRS